MGIVYNNDNKQSGYIENFDKLIKLAVSNDQDVYQNIRFSSLFGNSDGFLIPLFKDENFYSDLHVQKKDIDTLKVRLGSESQALDKDVKDFIITTIIEKYPNMKEEFKDIKASTFSLNIDDTSLNIIVTIGIFAGVALVCSFGFGMPLAAVLSYTPLVGGLATAGYHLKVRPFIRDCLKESDGMIIGNREIHPEKFINLQKTNFTVTNPDNEKNNFIRNIDQKSNENNSNNGCKM